MSISAERFKYFDEETNVAIQDFFEVVSNEVYTSGSSSGLGGSSSTTDMLSGVIDSSGVLDSIGGTQGLEDIVSIFNSGGSGSKSGSKSSSGGSGANTLPIGGTGGSRSGGLLGELSGGLGGLSGGIGSIGSVQDKLLQGNTSLLSSIQDQVTNSVESITNSNSDSIFGKVLGDLQGIDSSGVNGYFQDKLGIGKGTRCNSLGIVNYFSQGKTPSNDIVQGLMSSLTIDWLDKRCKQYSDQELSNSTNKEKFNLLYPNQGSQADSSNVLNTFKGYMRDYNLLKTNNGVGSLLSNQDILTKVKNGNIDEVVNNISLNEVDTSKKNEIISSLVNDLGNYTPGSDEYNNLLIAKARVSSIPYVSEERKLQNIRFSDLNNKIGNFLKVLPSIELPIPDVSEVDGEPVILDSIVVKLTDLQRSVVSNPQIMSTPVDGFSNFNFDNILPTLTEEEYSNIDQLNLVTDSHRYRNFSVTTEFFLSG